MPTEAISISILTRHHQNCISLKISFTIITLVICAQGNCMHTVSHMYKYVHIYLLPDQAVGVELNFFASEINRAVVKLSRGDGVTQCMNNDNLHNWQSDQHVGYVEQLRSARFSCRWQVTSPLASGCPVIKNTNCIQNNYLQ